MDHKSTIPPPYIPRYDAVFRCKMDKRIYIWPIIMWCVFDVTVFFMASSILLGLISILWVSLPLLIVVLFARYMWKNTTYAVVHNELRISTPLKSLTVSIGSIKKIRRGKFWVESGRNYSAAYIKLRIIYDRSSYVYVSPEDRKLLLTLFRL